MEEREINKDLVRLGVVTLLIAGMFGILQYFPEGKTFNTLGIGAVLKVIASVMLYFPFPIFATYIIFLGLNLRYGKKRRFVRTQAFFYDLGLFSTTFVIIFSALFAFFIWILINFPKFPMWIVVSTIWLFMIIVAFMFYKWIRRKIKL